MTWQLTERKYHTSSNQRGPIIPAWEGPVGDNAPPACNSSLKRRRRRNAQMWLSFPVSAQQPCLIWDNTTLSKVMQLSTQSTQWTTWKCTNGIETEKDYSCYEILWNIYKTVNFVPISSTGGDLLMSQYQQEEQEYIHGHVSTILRQTTWYNTVLEPLAWQRQRT